MKNAQLRRFLTSTFLVWLISAPSVFSPAYALEYECSAGNEQRYIRLEMPGEDHLCEVTVTPKNGQREVKWYANSESTFCTEKTNDLKDKYEQLWGFSCTEWPDTDGINRLSKRHRVILDAELKILMALGKNSSSNFTVKAVKASASVATGTQELPAILAIQYFLSDGVTVFQDITHLIHDDGISWFVQSRVNSLASYITDDTEYEINSALISSISNTGDIEVSTKLSNDKTQDNCYGAQTFLSNTDGGLTPRTPHRFVCQ